MPNGAAVASRRKFAERGRAGAIRLRREGSVGDVYIRDHAVVDVAADRGDTRLVELDWRRLLPFVDLEGELLDRRERIDLMHGHIVVGEDHMAASADHGDKRQERFVPLIDERL